MISLLGQLVADSINDDYKDAWDGFKWSGYVSLAILYWANGITLWLTPSLISYINSKRAIALGAFGFKSMRNPNHITFKLPIIYNQHFFQYSPIYSLILGKVMWNGQGSYVSTISDDNSITRDTGIFWAFLQCGTAVGNVVVAFLFQNTDHIEKTTRSVLYSCLIGFGLVGIFLSFFLKTPSKEISEKPVKMFVKSVKQLATKRLALLAITSAYTGLETCFFATLYGTSVGFTKAFGSHRKQHAGETGTLIGLGQVCAGLLLILTRKHKKPEFILIIAYVLSLVTFTCIYLNIPDTATLGDTDELAVIHSSLPLALICAFSLGFIDGCFETQIFRYIIKFYAEDSTGPFAIYLSLQALAMGLMYLCSGSFGIHFHCIMLSITCTIGTACFFLSLRVKDSDDKVEDNVSKTNSHELYTIETNTAQQIRSTN
uniref:UNC93-like protein MFSD11 n=1 Tax=Tetranychus urticae TaxID=32264 RepID=T1KI19_TETUR